MSTSTPGPAILWEQLPVTPGRLVEKAPEPEQRPEQLAGLHLPTVEELPAHEPNAREAEEHGDLPRVEIVATYGSLHGDLLGSLVEQHSHFTTAHRGCVRGVEPGMDTSELGLRPPAFAVAPTASFRSVLPRPCQRRRSAPLAS